MKKYFFFYILLLLPIIGIAQTYKYIGVEDGLSNRRVYAIQKGPKGYMWFLTHDGIDRYNRKDYKGYGERNAAAHTRKRRQVQRTV